VTVADTETWVWQESGVYQELILGIRILAHTSYRLSYVKLEAVTLANGLNGVSSGTF